MSKLRPLLGIDSDITFREHRAPFREPGQSAASVLMSFMARKGPAVGEGAGLTHGGAAGPSIRLSPSGRKQLRIQHGLQTERGGTSS
jgi:hypothetical protein